MKVTELKLITYNASREFVENTIIECVTNNFKKWLERHNKKRIADGGEPEHEDEFDVEDITVVLFKKEIL